MKGVLSVFLFKFFIWFSRLSSQKVENSSIEVWLIFELARGRKFSGEQISAGQLSADSSSTETLYCLNSAPSAENTRMDSSRPRKIYL